MSILLSGGRMVGAGGSVVATGIPTPFPAYVLKFFDNFTSFTGSPDGSSGWGTAYQPGGNRTNSGNNELECYCDSSIGINPFSIVGGSTLEVTTSLATVTGTNPLGLPYNSGLITSANSSGVAGLFAMEYGYFEIRTKLPAGQGFWPAFWLRPPAGFTSATEIDIFEMLGNQPTVVYQSAHYGPSSGGSTLGPTPVTISDSSLNYHTYSCDWDPTNLTYYIDRVQTVQYSTPTGFNQPLCIIANLAVGGNFPGPPDGSTVFPSFMDIDYIAAWANASSTNISGSGVIP